LRWYQKTYCKWREVLVGPQYIKSQQRGSSLLPSKGSKSPALSSSHRVYTNKMPHRHHWLVLSLRSTLRCSLSPRTRTSAHSRSLSQLWRVNQAALDPHPMKECRPNDIVIRHAQMPHWQGLPSWPRGTWRWRRPSWQSARILQYCQAQYCGHRGAQDHSLFVSKQTYMSTQVSAGKSRDLKEV